MIKLREKNRTYREEREAAAPQRPRAAATRGRPRLSSLGRAWLLRHAQVLVYALGQLARKPVASLLTAAVIGIALALPAGLHVLLENAQRLMAGFDGSAQLSLFLKGHVQEAGARDMARRLEAMDEVAQVQYISREQALEEFRRLSGFGDALDALDENPLPAVLVVRPSLAAAGPGDLETLLDRLKADPAVDMAQLDMQWVKRLYALTEIGRRGIWVVTALLGLAVLLVVGNTIRLAIQNRRDEIVVTKLIGGTDAFIRRPFLYTGLWYGIFGGLIALVLVEASLLTLAGPVQDLAGLYGSQFSLTVLEPVAAIGVLGGGSLLGLLGSWFAVGRHLRSIEPT